MQSASLPILFSFRRCPYAMRARMALAISGVATEKVEVVLRDKPSALLAASPKGTVPVIVLPDGHVLEQSLDIIHWALRQNDPENWLAAEDVDLIAQNDGPFKHHLDRYKYPERHGSDPLEHRSAGLDILLQLDALLTTQPYLCRNSRSITDAAIMPFVRQFAATDRAWFDACPLPALRHWLDTMLESALFKEIMAR